MAELDLNNKTVVELRKIAKEYGVTLGAGISKAGIIEKLEACIGEEVAPAKPEIAAPRIVASANVPAPARVVEAAETAPETKPADATAPQQFRAAWHNPAPRYGTKPAYQAPAQQRPQQTNYQRPAAPNNNVNTVDGRGVYTRPTGYTPRFGPAAHQEPAQPRQEEQRPYQQEAPQRPAYTPAPERRSYESPAPWASEQRETPAPRTYQEQPSRMNAFGGESTPAPAYQQPQQPAAPGGFEGYNRGYTARPAYSAPRSYAQEPANAAPAMNDMLTAAECGDGEGVLELHPEGYGFLRGKQLLSTTRDIYVSQAQVRRFALRTGDHIVGKTRPQRDGDKFTAMLYITEVNGLPADQSASRPCFEDLTPVYPTRRINLESAEAAHRDLRLVDLIAPLGFGQRALMLCPPECGKTGLMKDFANVIAANHPGATVMALLIDETPEDVTLFRDDVTCQVVASTFDQPPENHLRLTDMVLERAQRLVEMGKDVVLLVDSLTRLAKVYTSAAAQQGRSVPGMVNPSSLFKAKKLFGAARATREGGTLTIIAAMNIETGNKVDDAVVEEFKGTANMELVLDASVARAGVSPAINLGQTGTKRGEALLTPQQQEGLQLIHSMAAGSRSAAAIPQLLSMMEMAGSNEELLSKIKGWAQLSNKNG